MPDLTLPQAQVIADAAAGRCWRHGDRDYVTGTQLATTFDAARKRNVYELARQWADRGHRADLERDAPDVQLGELATMAALADRLTGWLPLQVHRAILAGATPEQAAAACGADVATVADRWRQWADGQRDLRTADGSEIGITADEYDRVAPQLAEGPC